MTHGRDVGPRRGDTVTGPKYIGYGRNCGLLTRSRPPEKSRAMKNQKITLTWPEVWQSSIVGIMRRITSLKNSATSDENMPAHQKVTWATDIDAACAEMAYAKATNRYWDGGVNRFKSGDVGDVQIRSTNYAAGNLIIRDRDSENEFYVLVTCQCPEYVVVGGIIGSEAKQPKYLKIGTNGGSNAWWVPQLSLGDFTGKM